MGRKEWGKRGWGKTKREDLLSFERKREGERERERETN